MLEKYGKQGEKTGWTYFIIRSEVAAKIKPGFKKSFRVKGKLDEYSIKGVSILPVGEGDFIMPVNAVMRKGVRKKHGEKIVVQIEADDDPVKISEDFMACLEDDKQAKVFFLKLPKSHQNYYSKWIESAKTSATKAKRIAQSINGFKLNMGYPEMMRHYRDKK